MHEMVSEVDTEQALKEKCIQVGDHLYVRPGSELSVGNADNADKESIQIVFSMGGRGIRLRHITGDKYSKHVIEIRGKPISRYVVDMWIENGFKNFCLLTDDSHRGKSVMEHYKNGEKLGVNIKYSIEHRNLGSGGAMKQAIDNNVITKSFVNHYPDDVIINYPNFAEDFVKIFLAAIHSGFQCVVLCVPGKLYPYGVVVDKGGKVVDFIEKPFVENDTNTGIFGISKDVFHLIEQLEPNKSLKIERTVLKQVSRNGKMFKVLLPTEYWIPVNDEMNLNKLVEITGEK